MSTGLQTDDDEIKPEETNETEDLNEFEDLEETQESGRVLQSQPASYMVPNQRPVFSQGGCGSCWAWAAKHLAQDALMGSTEVSAQNIMDCTKGTVACNGGNTRQAMTKMLEVGYAAESVQKYTAKGKAGCNSAANKKLVNRKVNYYYARSNEEIRAHLTKTKESHYLAVSANAPAWRSYKGGILPFKGGATSLDHAVTLVGYGNGYWNIRNSWGARWGENGGHVRISVNNAKRDNFNCIFGTSSSTRCSNRFVFFEKTGAQPA